MNYVRNAWYVASWAHDLKPNLPVGMRILDEPIVLWRNSEGALTALQDRCVHRMAPLSLGRCEGDKLRCMYHGLLFNRDGNVVEIPGQPKSPITRGSAFSRSSSDIAGPGSGWARRRRPMSR